MQFLCHVYTVHRLCRHFPHVSQDICSAPSSGAGRPTLAVENSMLCTPGGGGGGSPVMVLPVSPPTPLYNDL